MKLDEHGHVVWTPKALYAQAQENPRRLIAGYLMAGHTPFAFPTHDSYCEFLEAIADRTGLHPRNVYLRGSSQIGFSIAPRVDKVWAANREKSDLDLVIVDPRYFRRIEIEIFRWESRNPGATLQDRDAEKFAQRRTHRLFNCCWDDLFPPPVGVHHKDSMEAVADLRHCGVRRKLSAFIYPDWLSAKRRYERDIQKLVDGVQKGTLEEPGNAPVSTQRTPRHAPTPLPAQVVAEDVHPNNEFGAGVFEDIDSGR